MGHENIFLSMMDKFLLTIKIKSKYFPFATPLKRILSFAINHKKKMTIAAEMSSKKIHMYTALDISPILY